MSHVGEIRSVCPILCNKESVLQEKIVAFGISFKLAFGKSGSSYRLLSRS